jgi:hypothetical protein
MGIVELDRALIGQSADIVVLANVPIQQVLQ